LKNLDELSKHHTVYAIDLLGFGRSSRAPFPGKTAEEAEEYFIQSLEAWRATLGLEDFDLLGHSMGAYISTTYALKYPTNIKRLLLADPWGVPEKPPGWENRLSPVFRTIFKVVSSLSNSPLSLLRAAGPAGPALIGRVRPDLINKFGQFFPEKDSTALDYIYHVNAQSPAGEEAFGKLLGSFAFAARPLVSRIHNLPETLPVSFIYGEDTWMDKHSGIVARQAVRGPTDFVVIPDAGHHVYIDNFPLFNEAVALATKGKLSVLSNKLSGLIDEIRPDTRLSP
jgi:pimeloyl-ACP methyl ester carboxylesterase